MNNLHSISVKIDIPIEFKAWAKYINYTKCVWNTKTQWLYVESQLDRRLSRVNETVLKHPERYHSAPFQSAIRYYQSHPNEIPSNIKIV